MFLDKIIVYVAVDDISAKSLQAHHFIRFPATAKILVVVVVHFVEEFHHFRVITITLGSSFQ